MKKLILSLFLFAIACISLKAQVKIGNNPNTINANSILELESTTKGLLIPRMTTSERNALVSPPNGLQIFNTTTNMINIYRLNQWVEGASTNPLDNLVHVYSTSDLPTPSGGAITLDATKMYVFTGIINISPNYINLNGANLRGNDPSRDGVMSSVSGGILRSTGVSVYMENFAVIPLSAGTKAYDFTDATRTKFCNIFSGCSVVEIGTPSLGVGQISGFNATTIENNYWNCKDGIKITGTVGKFCMAYNFITNLSEGAGIEFLAGLTIDDIDLSNNYFVYTGLIGVKLNAGATVDRGRMTTNMFRGVTTNITGFNSYTPAWEMRQNTGIPNTRVLGSLFMTNNATTTNLTNVSTFYKIAGASTAGALQRFSASNNRLTYQGLETITGKVLVIVGAKSSSNNSDFTIAIAKNGTVVNTSIGSMATVNNNQSFQIILSTEVDLLTNDYIEVFIRTNNGNAFSIAVEELQFKLTD